MKPLKTVLFVTVLALIGLTAGMLAHAKSNQKLGLPGVKTRPLANSGNLEVELPDRVPGYSFKAMPPAEVETNLLPRDTSFGQGLYTADDGFASLVNVVLMGSSRASMHDPQICLTAQGWKINNAISRVVPVRLEKPVAYDLPVMRLTSAGAVVDGSGQKVAASGIYAYWFVDADRLTAVKSRGMLWTAKDMLFRNVLDRWAYVSFFAVCQPGQEDATFDRMKKLMAASVPEFQLVPAPVK